MSKAILIREPDAKREKHSWGELHWFCGHDQGKSRDMTFARCRILPDCNTHEHYHPECEEIIHVVDGILRHHVAGEDTFHELTPGDTIVVPPKLEHQIQNIGDEQADLVIVWSSTQRKMYEQ
mgnify:CR=1 FL=1